MAGETDDDAIEELFEIHNGLGAATGRDVFGKDMLADHRMAVELEVETVSPVRFSTDDNGDCNVKRPQ